MFRTLIFLFLLIFIATLLFIGSAVQGVLGFGFAVIASPIIVQIEPSLVPQLLALLGLPIAVSVFYREKEECLKSLFFYFC